MKILVTGAAGFIGSDYVRQQLADAYPDTAGAEVSVLDKLTLRRNPHEPSASVSDSTRFTASLRGTSATSTW